MPSRTRFLALALGLFALGAPRSEAKEKSDSSSEKDALGRVGYHLAPGAQVVGEPVSSPDGEDVAFFEQNGEVRELVVCPRGAVPGRWTVTEETTRLHIFWTGRTEIVLGSDVLAPKMRVRWALARS